MIALFAAATLALTQADPEITARMSRAYRGCIAAAGRAPARRLACLTAETQRQDDLLNVVYRRIRTASRPAARTDLRDTQRAWIRLRNDYCATERARARDETRAAIAFQDCYLTETVERTIWLENQEN